MALDDLDTTLDQSQDDQNTETKPDETEEPEEQEETTAEESSDDKQEEDTSGIDPSAIDLDSLTDDEFTEFLQSGKLPESVKLKKLPEKPTQEEPQKAVTAPVETQGKDATGKTDKPSQKAVQTSPDVNHKEVYDKIFAGFRANGKEIKPRNVEDVISLMQMGANYTKKMQALVPMRKVVESLNQAGINEEQLNFLIDLHKGNPEAIKKMLQTHKVDPMELDLEKTNYVPNNNIVSDDDAEYANVLADVKESLPKIKEIMSTKWDAKSKDRVLKDESWLRGLHEEIQMGRFDEVQARLESEKTFGRYQGVPDIDAYRDIVLKMAKEQQTTQAKPNTPKRVIPDKKGAAPTKVKAGAVKSNITKKDIFDMSEDDFMKLSVNDLV